MKWPWVKEKGHQPSFRFISIRVRMVLACNGLGLILMNNFLGNMLKTLQSARRATQSQNRVKLEEKAHYVILWFGY